MSKAFIRSDQKIVFFDFAVSLPSASTHDLGAFIPLNSVITGAYLNVLTAFSVVDVNISFGLENLTEALFVGTLTGAYDPGITYGGKNFNLNPLTVIGGSKIQMTVGLAVVSGSFQLVVKYDVLDRT